MGRTCKCAASFSARGNMTVFYAVLKPCDVFMGMNLAHGHLSHGMALICQEVF